MDADAGFLGQLGPSLLRVLPMLDERSRRLVLGMAAEAEGKGGTSRVAAVTGASWQTVANGKAELAAEEEIGAGRTRRPGGGRKPLAESDPGLAAALEELIAEASRGDPESPLIWTTRSAVHLADELAGQGHRCSPSTVLRMLGRMGYTQQSNSRAQEARQHPERDRQFRHIAARSKEFTGAGDPVISVDAKKREKIGNYGQDGQEWAPAGRPVVVRSHDFPDKDGKHAIPYGIYDEKNNAGFVNVGTGGNTAALAVESIRRWHAMAGMDAYPDAGRLLVVCDAGGSNGYAGRAWLSGLADLAQETGLDIEVCHFPPGTSKWNTIEHRLFCQISLAWRARPLTSYDVVISTIGAVTTSTGLTATAVLDENPHPTGVKISDARIKDIQDRCLTRAGWHGEWNYTLLAVPRPAPAPQPPPAPPGPDLAALAHPAITGLPRNAFDELAASLETTYAAAREQRLHLARGGPRRHAGGPAAPVKLSLPAYLLAAIYRYRLGMTGSHIAAVLGADPATISVATRRIADLLGPGHPALQPAPHRLRTPADLHRHAAAAGITINPPPEPRLPRKPH